MKETANIFTLPNGMRVIHIPSPTSVAYCGISIDAGTRDELETEQGMAHFCEHMMFKGTVHRRASHIIKRMEGVGGDLNAYTNKEETVVYSAFMKEHLSRAVELLFDVVFNSTYPQHEIDKECEVIVDEIESYNDSPADLIFDRFENIIYEGKDLGHDILGKAEDVRRFRSEDAKAFTKRLYTAEKMVMFVMGDYRWEKVKKMVEKAVMREEGKGDLRQNRRELWLEKADEEMVRGVEGEEVRGGEISEERLEVSEERLEVSEVKRRKVVCDMGTHQAHVMIGRAAYGSKNDKRIALYFLNNILGGPGMNSRLNVALREKRGLVYTVESSLTNYTDTSTWAIYFGCDVEDVDKCCKIVRKELDKLMEKPLSKAQFDAALKQTKGQIGVACDNFENYILDTAKAFLHYNKFEGVEDTYVHLDKLTPELLQEVAREIFDEEGLTTLVFK